MATTAVAKEEQVHLKRVFTLWGCVAYVVSTMIGTGIFITPNRVFALTGSPAASLAVWTGTAVINFVCAFCYVELGLTFPKSGSDYVFIHEAFGEFPSFVFSFGLVVFRNSSARAAYALAFSNYFLQIFWDGCHPPILLKKILAVLVLSTLGMINSYSAKLGVQTAGIASMAKMLGVLSIVLPGIGYIFLGKADHLADFTANSSEDIGDYVTAFYGVYFTFSGAFFIVNVIEEVCEPVKRNLILGIIISVGFVTVLFILTNVALFAVLSPTEIISSEAVAMTFVCKLLPGAKWFMPLIVALSVFGSVNNSIIHGSRLTLSGTRNGHFPRSLSLVQDRLATPISSVFFNTAISIFMVSFNDLFSLIVYVSYLTNVTIALSVFGLIYCRLKRPELERPFKLPLWIPCLYVLVLLVLLVYPFVNKPMETCLSLMILFSGVPLYFLFVRKTFITENEKFLRFQAWTTHSLQKLFMALPATFDDDKTQETLEKTDVFEQNGGTHSNGKIAETNGRTLEKHPLLNGKVD